MELDDFLRAQSTHALLLGIFNAESGISRPAHPALQVEALLQAFKKLQVRAASGVGCNFTLDLRMPDGRMACRALIAGSSEARLFAAVYGPLSAFTRQHGTGDLEHVLNHLVYPRLGPAVLSHTQLRAGVLTLLAAHGGCYGEPAKQRLLLTLPRFGMADLEHQLLNAPCLGAA